MTLFKLFPGNTGRVELTRVALRLRRPELLRMKPTSPLDPGLVATLQATLSDLRRS